MWQQVTVSTYLDSVYQNTRSSGGGLFFAIIRTLTMSGEPRVCGSVGRQDQEENCSDLQLNLITKSSSLLTYDHSSNTTVVVLAVRFPKWCFVLK